MCEGGQQEQVSQVHAALTFQERFYWAIHNKDSGLYRLDPFSFLITGELDREYLQRSVDALINRHEVLRTRFSMVDGGLRHRVDERVECPVVIKEVGDTGQSKATECAEQFIQEVADRTHDLSVGPLFNVALIKLTGREQILVFGIHHLLFDAVTIDILFREFWLRYAQFILGYEPKVQRVSVRYAEYRLWQEKTHRLWVERHRHYWVSRLSGGAAIEWPGVVKNATGHQQECVSAVERSFGETLSAEVHSSARRLRTSVSLELLAAYAAVISQLNHQRDFIVGTMWNGRDHAEHSDIAGYLAHPLYLRVQMSGEETFRQLLENVSTEFRNALVHKDFGGVCTETMDLFGGTLFQWMPASELGVRLGTIAPGVDVKWFLFKGRMNFPEKFKLILYVHEQKNDIGVYVRFRPQFIAGELVERLLIDLEAMLRRLVRNPHARIA